MMLFKRGKKISVYALLAATFLAATRLLAAARLFTAALRDQPWGFLKKPNYFQWLENREIAHAKRRDWDLKSLLSPRSLSAFQFSRHQQYIGNNFRVNTYLFTTLLWART